MFKPQLDLSSCIAPLECLPDCPEADAAEAAIEATLPAIEGLEDITCPCERHSLFSGVIALSRAAFVRLHGDPFGCESVYSVSSEAHKLQTYC